MRDITTNGNINVSGDLNISDHSETHQNKMLFQLSTEELLQERPFRLENIRIEQSEKVRRLKPFYALTLFLVLLGAIFSAVYGSSSFVTLLTWLASAMIGINSLNVTVNDNAFQKLEREAVQQINILLKQRRVK